MPRAATTPARCGEILRVPVRDRDVRWVEGFTRECASRARLECDATVRRCDLRCGECFQLVSKKSTATTLRNYLKTLHFDRTRRGFESHHPDQKPLQIKYLEHRFWGVSQFVANSVSHDTASCRLLVAVRLRIARQPEHPDGLFLGQLCEDFGGDRCVVVGS